MAEAEELQFSAFLVDMLNKNALASTAVSADDVAATAGTDPRYTYEILCGLTAGKVLRLAGSVRVPLFVLPAAHARLLTASGGDENMAPYVQEIPMLVSAAYGPLQTAVRTGDGVPYEPYEKCGFHTLMEKMSAEKHSKHLIQNFLLRGFPEMAHRLQQGSAVLDVGCGSGTALCLLAKHFPKSRFTGLDFSAAAIGAAREAARAQGLVNVEFVEGDAAAMDKVLKDATFDWIVAFDAIHDQTQPAAVLRQIAARLTPTGVFSMVDIKASTHLSENLPHVFGPFLYGVSLLHCLPVGKLNDGTGLGMMWGMQRAEAMLKNSGFASVTRHDIPGDTFNLEYRCKKN